MRTSDVKKGKSGTYIKRKSDKTTRTAAGRILATGYNVTALKHGGFLVQRQNPSIFDDREVQRKAIKEGIPVKAVDELRDLLDLSEIEIASSLRIAQRTLGRRKASEKFNVDESEKVFRFQALYKMALDLFKDILMVRDWFKDPNVALGGRTPLEYADTEPGAREVEDLLGRLAHGVFS